MITGLSQHGVDEHAPPTQDVKRAYVALKAEDHGTLEKARRLPHQSHRKPHQTPHIGFVFHDNLYFLRRREATTKIHNFSILSTDRRNQICWRIGRRLEQCLTWATHLL